ncbi:MAG: heat-inducible transcriptional repressor HrcA [Clostridia bacterium]|nr:heat-inducible transcriptional repressor HrcA [Clostridia bacterium]
MAKKELSERKQKILTALVDDYIMSAEPVSSKDIQSKYMPEVSSATIRSELSALEEMGFIEQPHTSAGRVPLPEAYRHYVEKFMDRSNLSSTDVDFIRQRFQNSLGNVRTLSAEAAKIISDTTNYTSIFVGQNQNTISIQEVKLVPMSNKKAVVLVLTDGGMLADKTIDIPESATLEGVETASRILNKVFSGKCLTDIERFPAEIETELKDFQSIFNEVLTVLKSYCAENGQSVFVEGALKILDYPEYTNKGDAKKFLQVISDDKCVAELVNSGNHDIEYSIKIGRDAEGGIDNCAIVTAEYKINGQLLGQAGVIGPERMDYKRVLSVLECIRQSLTTVMNDKKTTAKNNTNKNKNDFAKDENDVNGDNGENFSENKEEYVDGSDSNKED